jgi:hypothetical protein
MLCNPFFIAVDSALHTPHSEFCNMKGPYQRLKFDLRRLWECPVCRRRERTAGTVTFRHCLCQIQQLDGKPVVMKLVADGVQRLVPPVVIEHEALVVADASPAAFSESAPIVADDLIPPGNEVVAPKGNPEKD